jgi:putative endonuclease
MLNSHQQFGKKSESIAVTHLKKIGYRILHQNYRTKLGEIDIIAKDKDTLVFVEVKARRSNRFGNPKWAVTPQKQRTISMVALYYLNEMCTPAIRARFDVVSILSTKGEPLVEVVKNAFPLAYQ